MSWQPNPEALNQLVTTFKAGQSSDNAVQGQVRRQMEEYCREPDFSNYLVYILCNPSNDAATRTFAGLALKNHVSEFSATMSSLNNEYLKDNILKVFNDPSKPIRNITGSIISAFIKHKTIYRFPDILNALVDSLQSHDTSINEAGLSLLYLLLEDVPAELDQDVNGIRPLSTMVPIVSQLMSHQADSIRVLAIKVVTQAVYFKLSAMDQFMESLINSLFQRTQDSSPNVHTELCRAFTVTLSAYHQLILPNLGHIAQYMFNMTQVDDEEVSLEACEFWLAIAEHEQVYKYLRPFIGALVPVLVKGMVYTELEIDELEASLIEASVPDKDEDIKPRFHQAREHEQSHVEDDDEAIEGFGDVWNIRKCSAASLDQISTIYGNEILPFLLPLIKEQLYSEDWKKRECGILILGAIAEGCNSGILPHLPGLIDYLLTALNDPKPLVQVIACWTLSRYADWITSPPNGNGDNRRLASIMTGLAGLMLNNLKRIQEASCNSIIQIITAGGSAIDPFISPLLDTYSSAFPRFQRKNLPLLFDFVAALAFAVGDKFNQPSHIEKALPPLLTKWDQYSDQSPDIFPLFEAFSAVAIAIKDSFIPFAQPVYLRCVRILSDSLKHIQLSRTDSSLDDIDRDHMVVSLDLISAIAQSIGIKVSDLSASADPSLVAILTSCIGDDGPDVRQSAYALLGDLAIYSFDMIHPNLPSLIQYSILNFSTVASFPPVCNNLVWSLGEISLRWGEGLLPYIPVLLEKFIQLLNSPESPASLKENVAITISRFGITAPATVAPHLHLFSSAWSQTMIHVVDNDEKESAFMGFCILAKHNPNGLQESFISFCQAIESYQNPSIHLGSTLKETLDMFKSLSGSNWDQFVATFPPSTRQDLMTRFRV